MSTDGINPWEESKEESKEEAKDDAVDDSVLLATVAEEPQPASPERLVASPMTPVGEARRASDLRNTEAVLKDLENRYAQLRSEKDQVQVDFASMQSQLQAALHESKTLREALQEKEKVANESLRDAHIYKEKLTTLELDCNAKDERLDRLAREADDLRGEVSRLTEFNKTTKSAIADMESQAKVHSAESIPLQYEVQRLRTELDNMSAHTKWLDAELVLRSDQLVALTKDNNSRVFQLRLELDEMSARKETCEADLDILRKRYAALESKVEKLATENLKLKQEASDAKSEIEQNLISERRVVQLQKEQLDLLQKRHDDVVREMESMQALSREAADQSRREVESVRAELETEAQRILDEHAEEYRVQIDALKAKLEEASKLRQEAEDYLIESPTRASRRTLVAITAGDEKQGEEEELPLNLTDAYTLLRKSEQELREERKNHKLAQLRLRRIEEDVKAKMPHYIRQRQEYETAVARDVESRQRLKQAMADAASYRTEAQEARHDILRFQKRNRELEKEASDLAKQVQALLTSRAGGDASDGIPISVEEIQQQNQALLREHHRLTDALEVLKSDPLRSKLASAEKEIETLKEERQRSELYVASIVQQRDLLRAQLHLDSMVHQSETEKGSTVVEASRHAERIKELEAKNLQLENELVMAQAERNRLKNETDSTAERLLRYEAQVTTLSEAVDSYMAQVGAAKAEGARMGADAAYHREKCLRLEDSLQRSAAEAARALEAKSTLQSHNAQLHEALSEANAACTRLKQDLSMAETKRRMAETQLENAKSGEARAIVESDRLRADMARNGTLLETVHRIEASLTAKVAEESGKFMEDIARLREQLTAEQTKHSAEVDSLNAKVYELEAELKDLSKRKDDALTELVRVNEKLETSKNEIESLASNCSRLESQLRSAKRRLGEADGDKEDVEASLQAKIVSLSSELDSIKVELVAARASATTYQKIAKESEDALAELTKATDAFKISQEAEKFELQGQLAAAKQESASRQEVVAELSRDLSGLRDEHSNEVVKLKRQISLLENELEQVRKDAEQAAGLVIQLKVDVEKLRGESTAAQDNYDRELSLHSSARTALREAREKLESTINAKNTIEGQVQGLQAELLAKENAWVAEKMLFEDNAKKLESKIGEMQNQNDILYKQLETLGVLVEKRQEDRIFAATTVDRGETSAGESNDELVALQKSVSELRELIRFLRSEKEMLQVQLDTARRTADRERAAAAVARRSLDEARNELRVLQSNADESSNSPSSSRAADQLERLRASEEQAQLLHDSNRLLREQAEKLEKLLSVSQLELSEVKKTIEPYEQRQHVLEVEKAGLEAEKASLLRENEAWKGRLQTLVSKFNQIDPVEHESVLKQVETLKKEVETLKTQKKATDEEAQRIKAMAAKVNKDLSQQKSLLESQKKTIARLTAEKDALANSSKSVTMTTKEREQFKEKVKKFEEENASVKTELAGANDRNDKLRERLRQFQKVIANQQQKEKTLLEKYAVLEGELSQIREERAANASKVDPTEPQPAEDAEISGTTEDPKSVTQRMQAENVNDAAVGIQVPSERRMDAELPILPPGGFNFGPDRPSIAVSTAKISRPASLTDIAQVVLQSASVTEVSLATESGTVLPGNTSKEEQSASKADFSLKEQPAKKPPDVLAVARGDINQSTESESDSKVSKDFTSNDEPPDEIVEEKADDAGKGKEQKRPSGDKKEQSLKEKLLMQKKRRLEVELAQKKAVLSAKTIQVEEMAVKKRSHSDSVPDCDVPAEPLPKRTKSAEESSEGGSAPSGGEVVTYGETKTDVIAPVDLVAEQVSIQEKIVTEEVTQVAEDEQVESEDRDAADEGELVYPTEPEEQTKVDVPEEALSEASAPSSASSVLNPFATPFASSVGDKPFGGGRVVFGKAAGFSSQSSEAAENPTLGVFPASSLPSSFGSNPPSFGLTGGSSNPSGESGTVYGSGAFLNSLKPPGSSPVPTFLFGKSGHITLPTPNITTPTAFPFDAFPSVEQNQPSRAQPLFGSSDLETNNFPEDPERAEDSGPQDDLMGDAEDEGGEYV